VRPPAGAQIFRRPDAEPCRPVKSVPFRGVRRAGREEADVRAGQGTGGLRAPHKPARLIHGI